MILTYVLLAQFTCVCPFVPSGTPSNQRARESQNAKLLGRAWDTHTHKHKLIRTRTRRSVNVTLTEFLLIFAAFETPVKSVVCRNVGLELS